MNQTEVIYNAECPICSREVGAYRRHAQARGLPIRFSPLDGANLARWGLSAEDAARRFHVVQDGRLISGVPAFAALWSAMPRYRWLAWLVTRPGLRGVAGWGYDRLAAPLLYAMHRRRQARALHKRAAGG
ncbi:thiol-disulfide oxidoreductase DCC family protein [Rhodovulum adriaticum]|nr:DUF393 domain-containing protein [Rhodovulum adriaticum]MBK1636407.1 thiol-disulfide oxidoreductase [Rhodovulum adriaticum]